MRFLLRKGQRSEISLRCQYLYEVFLLWFFEVGEVGDFVILQSFPIQEDDVIVIYGHNYEIFRLFEFHKSNIKEKNVAIISCELGKKSKFILPNKRIFMAPQRNHRSPLLKGQDFGFEFDLTDAELNLYNSPKGSPMRKITYGFMRIQ